MAREAIRIISQYARSAGPGANNDSAASGGLSPGGFCAAGAIPFDPGPPNVTCLPTAFRSSFPLYPPTVAFPASCGAGTKGYQLQTCPPPGCPEPSVASFFCPDILVLVEVNDEDPYFLPVAPTFSSAGNATPIYLAGSERNAGNGQQAFDDDDQAGPGLNLGLSNTPLLLIGGTAGAFSSTCRAAPQEQLHVGVGRRPRAAMSDLLHHLQTSGPPDVCRGLRRPRLQLLRPIGFRCARRDARAAGSVRHRAR